MTLGVQGKRATEPFDANSTKYDFKFEGPYKDSNGLKARYSFNKYNKEGEHRGDKERHEGITV